MSDNKRFLTSASKTDRSGFYIIGINAYHGDSAACLIKDGVLLAAVEEERIRRIKHWAGFPVEAIRYCLTEAGVRLDRIAHIALNRDSTDSRRRKSDIDLPEGCGRKMVVNQINGAELSTDPAIGRFTGEVHEIEHHRAHLASAFYVSSFDRASLLSVDGFGDTASAAYGEGSGGHIAIEGRIDLPHSLGIFYQAMTQWLGFPNFGDEYKVMGLASYGRPSYLDQMRRIVRLRDGGGFELALEYFRHHREEMAGGAESGAPKVGPLFSDALRSLLGPMRKPGAAISRRHMDIAHSVQAMYEAALFHMLNALHARHGNDCLALAGGCALNSVANGKICRKTPFKKLYVPAAAGDAGGAIGAAFAVWHELGGRRSFTMDHAYWGPQFSESEIGRYLESTRPQLEARRYTVEQIPDEAELCRRTAQAIADGKVVCWFQGRSEWGPRALGNRSILGDPRRKEMKDILNLYVKRREAFRPFAPSILREHVPQWFETDDDVPFMTQVFQVREEKRTLIPAVTHADGSGRLQTVHRESNPRYHALIEAFYELTGVPLVLNTSFNENEPMVCVPKDGLDCFLKTGMDFFILENWLIERPTASR